MRKIRTIIAAVTLVLVSIGTIMIYSSSGVFALQELDDSLFFLKRHILFLVIGFSLAIAIMAVDYRQLKDYSRPLLLFAIVILILVLFPGIGRESHGARRWFKIGTFFIQPSEFTKLIVLIYISDFLSRRQQAIKNFYYGFLPPMIVLGVVCLLILKQPDLGSSLLIGFVSLLLIFVAGARLSHIGALLLLVFPAFYFFVFRVPYRWIRIITFLDPWKDSHGAGFQLTQSQIALGSGGFINFGLGQSVQKLFYLPAAHTDFIFSIIGEEFGFVGTFFVILCFLTFIIFGFKIVRRTHEPFGHFLGMGIVLIIGLQAIINIGVSIGALPTKGLTLPFISYGGSALIVNLMFVGLLLNISRIQDLG